jgi:ubiquinone/menaquinone biosynthesis C-methylase UbiE
MDSIEHIKPDFPADAFAGTADYYARYRVPYPDRLLKDLLRRSGVSGAGCLLDVACGPGRIALPLSSSFREVWAIDLEPDMIKVAQSEAGRLGVRNIKWIMGRAEDLEASPASFELITIGEAFHRLDQQLVAIQALRWLKSGCCVTILGSHTILSGSEPWQRIAAGIIHRWRKRRLPNGDDSRPKPGSGPEHNEQVLLEAGFSEVSSYSFIEAHEWSIESILGYLFSTSVCSKVVLGDDAEKFESDLRAALLAHDPGGIYREETRWGYTIGRKPD